MNNQASLANEIGKEEKMANSKFSNESEELIENVVMISPGTMLRDARKTLSLSKEHIASKLNLTINIINNIENDNLDPLIPFTFNRGYLTNYAKLVGVNGDDVLASYQALNAATTQRSEMLSFSKETSKQAEHSRVMWLSYFIVAVLIGLTVLWWQQDSREQINDVAMVTAIDDQSERVADNHVSSNLDNKVNDNLENSEQYTDTNSSDDEQKMASQAESLTDDNAMGQLTENNLATNTSIAKISVTDTSAKNTLTSASLNALDTTVSQPNIQLLSTAVFTFNGDCWVNIFDANGERIAWGVKKSGYVMTIQGEAPLRITIGKPELTSITFNGQPVDMSTFETGNIAKFNLPMAE